MSTATIPGSELVCEDWQVTDEGNPKPASLIVQLRRHAHVLPYFRFVYAEGDHAQVKITFASHVVTVKGHDLTTLLAALATHRVVRIIQPTENEAKFGVRGPGTTRYNGPGITAITVEQVEEDK